MGTKLRVVAILGALALAPAHAQQAGNVIPGGFAALAGAQGIKACLGSIAAVETALLKGSEYSFRAFVDPRDPNAAPFSVIVDARRAGTLDRVLINIVASPVGTPLNRCVLMYEQTRYHDLRCEAVMAQMAPKAGPPVGNSYGAVTVDVEKNLTLTLVPVGTGQCMSVVKEVAF